MLTLSSAQTLAFNVKTCGILQQTSLAMEWLIQLGKNKQTNKKTGHY